MCFVILRNTLQFKCYFLPVNIKIDCICVITRAKKSWRAIKGTNFTSLRSSVTHWAHRSVLWVLPAMDSNLDSSLGSNPSCSIESLLFFHNKQQIVTNTYSDETGSGVPALCCRDNVPPSVSSASVCKNYSGTLHNKRLTNWLVQFI